MHVVACLLLTLAVSSPAPEITGTIADYNGKPVSDLSISVVGLNSEQRVTQTTRSGFDGSFQFYDLAPGFYGLRAKTDLGCAISDPIRVERGFTTVVRLRLVKGLCQNAVTL
jgi:hypothetical protein